MSTWKAKLAPVAQAAFRDVNEMARDFFAWARGADVKVEESALPDYPAFDLTGGWVELESRIEDAVARDAKAELVAACNEYRSRAAKYFAGWQAKVEKEITRNAA